MYNALSDIYLVYLPNYTLGYTPRRYNNMYNIEGSKAIAN